MRSVSVELRHLRCFVAVADAGSVQGGAKQLRVAQSALSRTIRDLERELGVELEIAALYDAETKRPALRAV